MLEDVDLCIERMNSCNDRERRARGRERYAAFHQHPFACAAEIFVVVKSTPIDRTPNVQETRLIKSAFALWNKACIG